MRRQMNGKAPAVAADLYANDPKGQSCNLNADMDEGVLDSFRSSPAKLAWFFSGLLFLLRHSFCTTTF